MGRRVHKRDECGMDLGASALPVELPVELDGRDFRGDLDIRIDTFGVWHYNHSPIEHEDMVCLFASMLLRDAHQRYWLVTPTELGRIDVDDAPLLAVDLHTSGDGEQQEVRFRTNVDLIVAVTPQTPLVMKPSPISGEMTPYINTADGIEVKITRAVYYDLVALGVILDSPDGDVLGVWSGGAFFPLGATFNTDA